MDDLYHQQILDIFNDPPHFGELKDSDLTLTETNSSCGDSFTFYINFSDDKKNIQDISFTGTGCAISTASTSLLVDHLIDQPISEINNIEQTFMESLVGTKITPARHKCLMLPVKGLYKINI